MVAAVSDASNANWNIDILSQSSAADVEQRNWQSDGVG